MPKRRDPGATLDDCVRTAIDRVNHAIRTFDGGCDKDSVANLAKLVGIIGDLRGMIGLDERADQLTGVILLPRVREDGNELEN